VAGFILFVITFRIAADVTTLDMSFAQASWLRVIQMLPLPFCFISITNAAYVGMPKEESNQVAGLINFVRNLGGSILIALTNAQVTSRAMWHQQHLQADMVPGAIAYQQHLSSLTGFLNGQFGGSNGPGMALADIYNQLNAQAQMQGYQDVYMELSWASCALILLAFLLSKNRPSEGGGGAAMH
jgi:MFS transporter, DHA2 family, multidrug resistance protein